ncbi:MAG TPA: energy transducer TonB [Acetobacteraceae bacterium]|nr:energy transducer TonB [Acetobacteraceae bacterium]
MMTTAPIIGAPIPRWPGAHPARRPSVASWGGAMLLHVAVGAVVLTAVRLAVAPPPSGNHTIALVFAPAPRAAPPVPRAPTPTVVQPPDIPAPPVSSPPPMAPVLPPEQPPPPLPAAVPPPPPALTAAQPPPASPPPRVPLKQPPVRPHPVASAPGHPLVSASARPRAPAPPSAPTPAPAGNPAPVRPAALAPIAVDWQRALASWLAAHKTYPDEARRDGDEGNVVLRFTVDRSGRVLSVERIGTNAPAVLGVAAEAMLRGAIVPPFPDTMPQDRITITVRVHYALTD